MHAQRQRSGERRRKRRRKSERPAPSEPVLIAARRPNAPLLESLSGRRKPVASARPNGNGSSRPKKDVFENQPAKPSAKPAPVVRRSARIIELPARSADDSERQRQRLLERLISAQGRIEISRACKEYLNAGFECPVEQEVQLQLLEHIDEARVRDAISALGELLAIEPPLKKTLLEHRLRRLEEYADEPATRRAASELRRALRDVAEPNQARM